MMNESSEIGIELTKVLVARFLRAQGYAEALGKYLKESGVQLSALDETRYEELESIVAERIQYNEQGVNEQLKNASLNGSVVPIDRVRYSVPSWNHSLEWKPIGSISETSQSLVIKSRFLADGLLGVSAADKSFTLYNPSSDGPIVRKFGSHSGIIKHFGTIARSKFYTCTIEGNLTVYGYDSEEGLQYRLPVRAVLFVEVLILDGRSLLCFYSSLDNTINACTLDLISGEMIHVSKAKILSTCTSLQVAFAKDRHPLVFISRQDNTQIIVYEFVDQELKHICNIALNTAQFSTHSFNIASMLLFSFNPTFNSVNSHVLNITDSTLLAVATSHTPYMRLLITKVPPIEEITEETREIIEEKKDTLNILDSYSVEPVGISNIPKTTKTYFDQIIQNMATVIPQDTYSQSILTVSRFLGGLVVGSDTGLYGIDLQKSESWPLKLHKDYGRVKSLDFLGDTACVAYSNKHFVVWKLT